LIVSNISVQPVVPIFNGGAFQEEDGTEKLSRNFGNELTFMVAKHLRRVTSLITLWRKPETTRYEEVTIAEEVKY
jgi:hypothetical protein